VLVTAASVSDNVGGIHVLSNIAADHPRVTKAWADTGYRTKVVEHGATLGIDVEVTRRDPAQKGFKVIPRRWVVERTFGWLMHHRRLARDYETHPHRSEAMTSENVSEAVDVQPTKAVSAKAVDDQLIDELVGRVQAEGLQLTGEGGLLQQLTKRLLEQPWKVRSPITSAMTSTIPRARTVATPATAHAPRRS
jgi:transposase